MSYVEWVYQPLSVTPPPALVVTTTTLPSGFEGLAYAVTLEATGATGAVTWAIVSGALPTGLTLDASTGAITGTPEATGTFTITVRATDASAATDDSGELALLISAAPTGLTVTTVALPTARRGVPYSTTLATTGATAPVTWSLVAPNNVLPTGLSLNASTGVIAGTPTVAQSVSIVVRATDATAATDDSGTLTITVTQVAALTITSPQTLARGRVAAVYTVRLTTSGGWGTKTWAKLSGDYPPGVTFDTASGTLSGTPTTVGTSVFTLRVTDAEARTADQTFSITIDVASAGEGPHDYYNEIRVLAECLAAHSLRSSTSLDGLISNWPSPVWSYVYGTADETYPGAPDAAKCVMPHSLSTPDQILFNLKPYGLTTGQFIAVVESIWMPECLNNALPNTGLQWKWQQFESKKAEGEGIHIEPRISFRPDVPGNSIGYRDLRNYPSAVMEGDPTTGVIKYLALNPTGAGAYGFQDWEQRPNIMCRDWFIFELSTPGTDFTDWCDAYTGGAPLSTSAIHAVTIDGADTVLTVDSGYVAPEKAGNPPRNWWIDVNTDPPANQDPTNLWEPGCLITIAGNSNPSLNGTWQVQADDMTHLRIRGVALTGAGGTASVHFTKFTWVHAEEDVEPFAMYYKVPIRRAYNGQISMWRQELNTSKDIDSLRGFFIQSAPTQTDPTVLDIGEHDLVDGDPVWVSGSDVIPAANYVATVVSPTEISLPVAVSTLSQLTPGGRPAIDRIDLGDIGAGDTFTLTFRDDTTGVIPFEADMSTAIRNALDALPGFAPPTVTKLSDQVYTIAFETTRANLIQITNPVGFTPTGTTRLQSGRNATYYSNTYGRVTKPLVYYTRNMVLLRNKTVDYADTAGFFRKPVR